MSASAIIRTEGLGRRFRRKWAVRDLTLSVPEGKVYGLLGLNGAGKSTTIRMLMGLLHASKGRAEVMGFDPARRAVEVKRRVGYVAETHNFYEWMTVREVTDFVARYRPDWDDALAEHLHRRFDLDPAARLSELSKGQRAKVSLTLALAFRPRLLTLDEPTSGLDPAARREFFEGVLANFQAEGGTIVVSSHLVNELSGAVDYVGLLREGRMELELPLEDLRASVKRIRLTFASGAPESEIAVPGLLGVERGPREAVVSVRDFTAHREQVMKVLEAYGPTLVEVEDLNLEDIFVALSGGARAVAADAMGEEGATP